jgi:hypothetical protein
MPIFLDVAHGAEEFLQLAAVEPDTAAAAANIDVDFAPRDLLHSGLAVRADE